MTKGVSSFKFSVFSSRDEAVFLKTQSLWVPGGGQNSKLKTVSRGFSLLETLAVIAILASAGLALHGAIPFFYQKNAFLFEGTTALNNARRGLTTTLQHIRETSYGEDGAYPLTAAATSSLTFHAEVDGDSAIERVRYFLQNGTFYESVTNAAGNPPSYTGQTAATSTVITYIANATSTPIFRYFDNLGVELTAPVNIGSVATVQVMMQIDLNPNRLPNIFTLSGGATLRNLRDQ